MGHCRVHRKDRGLYVLPDTWVGKPPPSPLVYGAESDSSHKGLWMDAKLLVVEGET